MTNGPAATVSRKVREVRGMYVHAAWYGAVMVVLAVWNLVWQPDDLWFVWPLVGWGLGVASHALAVFGVLGRGDRRDTDDAGGSGS